MSEQKVRRFSAFQIAFHWAVGLPYLSLLITGAAILLHRSEILHVPGETVIETIHRWIGIALTAVLIQMFIVALVSGQFLVLLRDFVDWVLIRPRDLLWLAKVPLNILWPRRFQLPPAGRFNAGQKLHGLFILVAVTVFSVTGMLMILRPAELRPWIIHSWLFFGAAVFLALHLFLGLINPVTRRALGGVFTGYVPRDYVQEHHALVLGETEEPAHLHAVVSWKALAATWTIAVLVISGIILWYGPHQAFERVSHLRGQEHAAISPGPLIAAHTDDPRMTSCQACHHANRPPSDSACLACHEPIRTVMRKQSGYHGQLQGHCRDCHADHKGRDAEIRPLDQRTFNHQLARFPLQGMHQALKCEQCHAGQSGKPGHVQFIGLAFSNCSDCHANPHDQRTTLDCARCHTERGFARKSLTFNHQQDAAFRLEGKHAQIACDRCHEPAKRATAVPAASTQLAPATNLRGILPILHPTAVRTPAPHRFQLTEIGQRCDDCHADPHQPSLGADCQRCHAPTGWTGTNVAFRHDRDTKFRLEQAHASLQCAQCHALPAKSAPVARAKFTGTPTNCDGCHQDPHRAQLGEDCTHCHQPTRWTGRQLLFVHNRDTSFNLTGQHAGLACEKCHKPAAPGAKLAQAEFKGLPTDCRDCHDDPHQKQFDKNCTSCHDEQGWKGRQLLFAHNRHSQFKLDALHDSLACASCHPKEQGAVRFRPRPTRCEQCHAPVAQAMAGQVPGAALPADPHNGRVKCVDCHSPQVRTPTPGQYADACQKCHTDRYRTIYFDWQRSLDERGVRVKQMIDRLAATDSAQAKAMQQRLDQARSVGMHNTQQAIQLLDDIRPKAEPAKRDRH